MHILTLEKHPTSHRGGQELSTLDVSRGLAAKGHKITLIHVENGNLLDQYRQFCHQILPAPSFGFSRRTLWKAPIQLPIDLLRTWTNIRHSRNAVLYCSQIYDIPAPALLSRLTHIPLVCHLRQPPPYPLNRLCRKALPHVAQYIAVSQHTRQEWLDFGIPASKITCIHNGTNPDRFTYQAAAERSLEEQRQAIYQQYNLPTDAQILTYTGRLDHRKGVEVLINALAQLHPSHPNLHLLIAGKTFLDQPTYLDTLTTQVQTLGLQSVIHFLGHVNDPRPLYAAADLAIAPSRWPEPFGRVIIEAMACGTPVVASRIGGIPEILTGQFAQGLCQPNDPTDLAQTIDRLLTWRTTQPHLGPASRHHILQNFSLTHTIQNIEAEFHQVITAHSPDKLKEAVI